MDSVTTLTKRHRSEGLKERSNCGRLVKLEHGFIRPEREHFLKRISVGGQYDGSSDWGVIKMSHIKLNISGFSEDKSNVGISDATRSIETELDSSI